MEACERSCQAAPLLLGALWADPGRIGAFLFLVSVPLTLHRRAVQDAGSQVCVGVQMWSHVIRLQIVTL